MKKLKKRLSTIKELKQKTDSLDTQQCPIKGCKCFERFPMSYFPDLRTHKPKRKAQRQGPVGKKKKKMKDAWFFTVQRAR